MAAVCVRYSYTIGVHWKSDILMLYLYSLDWLIDFVMKLNKENHVEMAKTLYKLNISFEELNVHFCVIKIASFDWYIYTWLLFVSGISILMGFIKSQTSCCCIRIGFDQLFVRLNKENHDVYLTRASCKLNVSLEDLDFLFCLINRHLRCLCVR